MRGAFRSSVWIGAAAYFIALRVPVIGWLLGWCTLGWAGWWFVEHGQRQGRLVGAAGAGAGAALVGTLAGAVLSLLLSVLHPLLIPVAIVGFFFALLRLMLIALPLGAACGLIGGLLAERAGRS